MTSASAHVPADLAALGAVRSHLAAALAGERWSPDASSRVLIASTEAMANAVEHGSAPGAGVDVSFTVTDETAWVRVLDSGCPGCEAPLDDADRPSGDEHGGPRAPADAGARRPDAGQPQRPRHRGPAGLRARRRSLLRLTIRHEGPGHGSLTA